MNEKQAIIVIETDEICDQIRMILEIEIEIEIKISKTLLML
jgi:hypothetical protein